MGFKRSRNLKLCSLLSLAVCLHGCLVECKEILAKTRFEDHLIKNPSGWIRCVIETNLVQMNVVLNLLYCSEFPVGGGQYRKHTYLWKDLADNYYNKARIVKRPVKNWHTKELIKSKLHVVTSRFFTLEVRIYM